VSAHSVEGAARALLAHVLPAQHYRPGDHQELPSVIWIPSLLYEARPYGYIALGVAVLLTVQHVVGGLAGLALIGLGAGIIHLRRRHRAPIIGRRL
jgi:hypothetical protein